MLKHVEKLKSEGGQIYSTMKISSMERTRVAELQAVADTGATLTVVPQKIARELEPGQFTREMVKSGAGEIELQRSSARISIDGKESVQDVPVSDFIDPVLLGGVTLETSALSLDPLPVSLKERDCYCIVTVLNSSLERSTSGESLRAFSCQ